MNVRVIASAAILVVATLSGCIEHEEDLEPSPAASKPAEVEGLAEDVVLAADKPELGDPLESNWGEAGRWPDGIIPYRIERSASQTDGQFDAWAANIREGARHWNANSVIVMVEVPDDQEGAHVRFILGDRNETCRLGYMGRLIGRHGCEAPKIDIHGPNVTSLIARHDVNLMPGAASARHEIGHVVGLMHEHQREDRDESIWKHQTNLTDADFWKCDFSIGGVGYFCKTDGAYDYDSLMHYASSQSDYDWLTMTRKDRWDLSISGGVGATASDFQRCRTATGGNYDLAKPSDSLVGNFDGDSQDELLLLEHDRLFFLDVDATRNDCSARRHIRSMPGVTMADIRVGDFDGDDRTDILVADGSRWRFLLSRTNYAAITYDSRYQWTANAAQFRLGDFDGDGFSDPLFHSGGADADQLTFISSASGTSVVLAVRTSSDAASFVLGQVRIGDLDGDGRDDVVYDMESVPSTDPWVPNPTAIFVAYGGGSGSWTHYGRLPGGATWANAVISDLGSASGEETLLLRTAKTLWRFDSSTRGWVDDQGWVPKTTARSDYRIYGDFSGNGVHTDVIMTGQIARTGKLSGRDIHNVGSYYGGCSDVARQRFMTCFNPIPLTPATVSTVL